MRILNGLCSEIERNVFVTLDIENRMGRTFATDTALYQHLLGKGEQDLNNLLSVVPAEEGIYLINHPLFPFPLVMRTSDKAEDLRKMLRIRLSLCEERNLILQQSRLR
jgi:hypothetical protein